MGLGLSHVITPNSALNDLEFEPNTYFDGSNVFFHFQTSN